MRAPIQYAMGDRPCRPHLASAREPGAGQCKGSRHPGSSVGITSQYGEVAFDTLVIGHDSLQASLAEAD